MSDHKNLEPHSQRTLPPGQRLTDHRPSHYGPVPQFDLSSWDLTVIGATMSGAEYTFSWDDVQSWPRIDLTLDLHCVSKASALDLHWSGTPMRHVLDIVPPTDSVTHVVLWAQHGYSSVVRRSDVCSARSLLATHLDNELLTPEYGAPMRALLPHLYAYKGPKWLRSIQYVESLDDASVDAGFWEHRGYHLVGDVWRQERYAYQQ